MLRHHNSPTPLPVFLAAACLFSLSAVAGQQAAPPPLITPPVRRAMEAIQPEALKEHVRYLADDRLEGRDTGSPGGLLAARYLASQFAGLRLKPGGDGRSYLQEIPFVASRMDPARSRLVLDREGGAGELTFGRDFLLNGAAGCQARVEASPVFAGYGIRAPEYQYDNYAGLDVKGKIIVYLSGEPTADPALFDGAKETRHASGQAKLALARSLGAVGAITLVTGERARRFPWDRIAAGQTETSLSLPDTPLDAFPALVVREEGAAPLFAGAPHDWTEVRRLAGTGELKPFALPGRCRIELETIRDVRPAPNVAALLEGSDPKLKEEVVVFSAHYDHVGRRSGAGDTIFNGAWDNASGTAAVLEVARAFTRLPRPPRRSVLFLLVTGEEKGLLGSRYYTQHPRFPIEKTAADINLDMTDIFGVPKEFVPQGAERSTLWESCQVVAREMGLGLGKDPVPDLNTFTRSDQYSFVRAGVPSMFLLWASEYEDTDAATARKRAKQKLDTIYHRPGDEFDPSWSWEGMRRQAQVAFLLGLDVAGRPEMPAWKAGDPFNKPRGTVPVESGRG